MDTLVLNVSGMSCMHCVNAVTKAIGALSGVHTVSVDLEQKKVTIERDPSLVTLEKITSEIEELGYEVSG